MSTTADPVLIRLAPELRRCALYVILATPLFITASVWVSRVNERPDLVTVGLPLFGLIGMSMVLPLRWALRVDYEGISRRRLVGWDLWSWSDFASGRIHKRDPFAFVDPARPWWGRQLWLGLESSADTKRLIGLINKHYRFPPPPVVRRELTITHGLFRTCFLGERGIELSKRSLKHKAIERRRHSWNDVLRVHITRRDPLRRDFVRLEIVLPDEEVILRAEAWRGASREELNEFLHQHVAPERMEIDIEGERPARRSDAQREFDAFNKEQRSFRYMIPTLFGLLVALLLFVAIAKSPMAALILGAVHGVLIGPLCWGVARSRRQKANMLLARLAEYGEESGK